jgi:hypothetical protein
VRNNSELFLGVLGNNYMALRLPVCPIVEAHNGSGVAEGLLRREGTHFMRWD